MVSLKLVTNLNLKNFILKLHKKINIDFKNNLIYWNLVLKAFNINKKPIPLISR